MSGKPEDTYADFADRYDLFHDSLTESNPDRVEFFQKVFADHKIQSVLDCACGTGRDLLLFAGLGLDAIGSDISESMLAVARKNLAWHAADRGGADREGPKQTDADQLAGGRCGADIPLERVDYRELPQHYKREFDAVVCLSSSILEMPNETEVLRALQSMRSVLRDGGILILTQGTADKMWAAKPRFIPVINRPGFSRIFVVDYLENGARFNVLDLFHEEGRSEFKVWSKEYRQVLLKDDHERLLTQAGFAAVEFYGSYRLDNYDPATSDVLICVAHR